jgi:hypothetical protein
MLINQIQTDDKKKFGFRVVPSLLMDGLPTRTSKRTYITMRTRLNDSLHVVDQKSHSHTKNIRMYHKKDLTPDIRLEASQIGR